MAPVAVTPRAGEALARLATRLPPFELEVEAGEPSALVGAAYAPKRKALLVDPFAETALSDDALSFMIAHELGHVFETRPRQMCMSATRSGAMAIRWLFIVSVVAAAVAALTHNGERALISSYIAYGCFVAFGLLAPAHLALARRSEYRADEFAVRLTGSDAGANELFKWLNSQIKSRRSGSQRRVPLRFRRHPHTGSRMAKIQSLVLNLK
jgi:Zn-dependent protease with chaperone function